MIWRLRRLVDTFAKQLQRICPHLRLRLRFVGDAWDQEYTCDFCDRRRFNEIPKLRRRFLWNNEPWELDGIGGVAKVLE